MTALSRVALAIACAASVCGCAALSSGPPVAARPSPLTTLVTAERATQAVVTGRSTTADVAAALGGTLAIRFHSGFEVWVYRLVGDVPAGASQPLRAPAARGGSAELVILFTPSGIVAKTRIRPASG